MKKAFVKLALSALFTCAAVATVSAQKKPWAEVQAPEITKISLSAENPNDIVVEFNLLTSNDGADKGSVKMEGPSSATKPVGKTRREAKKVEFTPTSSGTYTFTVYGERSSEKEKKASASKSFDFVLPLTKTTLSVMNIGDSKVEVKWTPVKEAEGYVLTYTDSSGKKIDMPKTTALESVITGLKAGDYSDITIAAVRGTERLSSDTFHKLVRRDAERIWTFTEFGTSTKPEFNRMEMLDPNDLSVRLYSCKYNPETGKITDKGGKFETFFDGISFYYTVIDPEKENFELTATVTVDYINPMADGQEGFGVLALDQLGTDGEAMVIAYSNSAGIISRKFTTHVNGVKKEIKDGIGARFVYDITPEILAMGDSALSQYSTSNGYAFSYDQSSDAVKTGDKYRVTLKKDNTGYHAIYKRAIASEDTVEEYIMYDTENQKLRVLDKDHVYLGFAVARGCNATFSDVVLNVTDPKTDAPAQPEPPILVPLNTAIQSPTTWYNKKYPFVFTANANGAITVKTNDDKVLINGEKVKAGVDYKKTLNLASNINDLLVTFDPEDGYEPAAGKQASVNLGNVAKKRYAISQYNAEKLAEEENYNPVTTTLSISVMTYKGKELYVSTRGNIFGKATRDDPIDLDSAIKYVQPGQKIVLLEGNYYPSKPIIIERGNDGTAKKPKMLTSEPGKRVVLTLSTFKSSVGAFQLFGNHWIIENIDLTKSQDDTKALLISGAYNVVRGVDAYENGDTGIQIAGRSSEPPSKWPHHNLVEGCESFGNCDPAQNNADGFAAKLTSGEGNIFRNCVAHHNVDDGWDLYAKIETGPIGAVLLENCIAYSNGRKIDNTGSGDGNGFKLGGDGIEVHHRLVNSIAFNNDLNGITTNSNPGLIVDHCTSFANKEANINLYGKGDASAYPRTIEVYSTLSINGSGMDKFDESKDPGLRGRLEADTNYFFNGAQSMNKSGAKLDASVFVNADFEKYTIGLNEDGSYNRIPRNAKGEFDLGDLFKLSDKAPANVGADYNYVVRGKKSK
ncbi:MAG: pectate lyase [Treponema sp.]|nr:pectate lyase [Treponema sp.]